MTAEEEGLDKREKMKTVMRLTRTTTNVRKLPLVRRPFLSVNERSP